MYKVSRPKVGYPWAWQFPSVYWDDIIKTINSRDCDSQAFIKQVNSKLCKEHKRLDLFQDLKLARKQGFNTLKSTAQWSWINIIGAHFYVQACQDANFQAVNRFSFTYSVVLFDNRGDYQLYYSYLAHLSVEQTPTTADTLRIGAAISEEHQVHFGLQSQQPHDLYMCGSLYVQQSSLHPSTSTDYMASTARNTSHTRHNKPTHFFVTPVV